LPKQNTSLSDIFCHIEGVLYNIGLKIDRMVIIEIRLNLSGIKALT